MLRFACLSSAESPGVHTVKMRATLKLNKTSGVPNAVAGKSISSSQRSNCLTVVSLLDTPDHNNVSGWMLARERDCDPQEFGIILVKGGKNGS
jgi:hypothetical protein